MFLLNKRIFQLSNLLGAYKQHNIIIMSTHIQQQPSLNPLEEPELTQDALDYEPTSTGLQEEDQGQYEAYGEEDDDSSLSEDQQPQIQIKNLDPKSIENPHQAKVYHQNQYTKLDQKMCFNKVQACENQEMIKEKKNKDKAQRATVEQVLDPRTLLILKKLINNGTLTEINGCLSTGKEANVYYGVQETSEAKKEYAIKIYKTSILVFKDRERYVQGEFRFRRGYCSSNPRKMVKMWAEKQLRNLNRIEGHMPCPSPLLVKSNVLVMDFIGSNGIPAPKLKDLDKDTEEFSHIYLELLIDMRLLYQDCKLIHADLSEYNLLYYNNAVHVIDVSQSVEHDHPQAINFLRRDICNVNDFFKRKGVKIFTQQEVFIFIVSLDVTKGKERQFLDELIDNYEEGAIQEKRDEVFNKIKIHQNLGSIPLEKVQKELFDKKSSEENSENYEHVMTGIGKSNKTDDVIEENPKEDKQSQSSSSSEEESDEEEGEQQKDEQGNTKQKEGGKQKYQGLTKQERKHKVKEEKREKRKEKIPKKTKKKMMKKN